MIWLFALHSLNGFALPHSVLSHAKENTNIRHSFIAAYTAQAPYHLDRLAIKTLLQQDTSRLQPDVVENVLNTLECADANHTEHNHFLTIIDYSLPSNEKRLWIFDLNQQKLLFHTYVSHGIRTGVALSNYFSNRYNSKASSIGVYKTEKSYYGRHGLSLQLQGLDSGFNDNASQRAVVMHGGWYVNEEFIQKYGRAGRSWGCPAVPDELSTDIINTIKNNSLLVIYYPSQHWLLQSKFLNCRNLALGHKLQNFLIDLLNPSPESERRDEVLFADLHQTRHGEETNPILVMSAAEYQRFFQHAAPLERMLRRQINNMEYIALSTAELNQISALKNAANPQNQELFNVLFFVVPDLKMVHGYYATEMKIVYLGKIKDIALNTQDPTRYTVFFEEKQSVSLKANHQFIRWLGL